MIFHVAFGVREKYDNGNGNFISCFSQIIPPTAANNAVIMPHPPQIKQKTCWMILRQSVPLRQPYLCDVDT